MLPSLPGEGGGQRNEELMPSIRRVVAYSGLDYHKALELPCDVFMLMVKNSYVSELQSTENGRAYLEQCARMKLTEPDIGALHAFQAQMIGGDS